jgi:hypothetical protein
VKLQKAGSALVGLAGLGLLATSFLDWFEAGGASADLWESFSVVDVVAACAIGFAIATGLALFAGDDSGLPVAACSTTLGVAVVLLVLLAYRLIDPPADGASPAIGAWLGLLATLLITLGSRLGIEEPKPRPEVA